MRSLLGSGGMGDVYLAQDTKLERTVALKLLPENVAADKGRMERFFREAKTASALNHPNILTIFEIGREGSTNFIATEFIDGETLRQRMQRSPLKLSEALNISTQTADAVAAAHEAGIIHRDIKPENIMLRSRDGYVKVLDFGLAKLVAPINADVDRDASTKALFKTAEGVVIGTLAYMSPEQARGMEVDARTDIWSLGVVLFEMISGCLPFSGSTASDVVASILNDKEVVPLKRFAREVPDELERIVEKALAKDPKARYQTAKDFLIDLKRLSQKLDLDAEIERTVPPELRTDKTEFSESPNNSEALDPHLASLRESSRSPNGYASSSSRKSMILAVLSVLLVLALAVGSYYLFTSRVRQPAINSIAVLPFINTSGNPNTEYLSDGISEALINSLTGLRQLRVIARATAFRYKGKEIDPQTVGRELNVRAVLMGQIRQQGDSLDIQVDLVDTSTGTQLWGAEYEPKVADVLSVKQTIAREVTQGLRLRLTGDEQQQLAKHDTTNAEAYQFYLKGRYFWNKRTADGLKKAIEQFQAAIDRDPSYALGYVGMADSYNLLEEYAGVPASEFLPKARAAADRAMQIDDTLAEAHAASGNVYFATWQWAKVESEFERAISLNPNYATAHHWLSIYFRTQGRLDDSLREIKEAERLDPLSAVIGQNVAELYLLKNDLPAAIAKCKEIIELDPNFPGAHDELGYAYLKQHRNDEALAEFQKTVELSGRASRYLGDLGYCDAVTGKRAEALTVVNELQTKYARGEAIGQFVAYPYAGLSDKDNVFAWLEKDYARQGGNRLAFIRWWFAFDDLRSDPRYTDLVRRIGLSP